MARREQTITSARARPVALAALFRKHRASEVSRWLSVEEGASCHDAVSRCRLSGAAADGVLVGGRCMPHVQGSDKL
jgi:hypothetical protein